MKSIQTTLLLFFSLTLTVYSQSIPDSLKFIESMWSMEKKALVLEHMTLTEAEKSAFWPVYESYSQAIQYLEMEYMHLVCNYSKSMARNADGKKLQELSSRILKNDLTLARVRVQYFKKFKKALTPEKASKFMQLDNTFRTMLRMDMQRDLPAMDILAIHTLNQE